MPEQVDATRAAGRGGEPNAHLRSHAILDRRRLSDARAELLRDAEQDVVRHVAADAHRAGALLLAELDVEDVEAERIAQGPHETARGIGRCETERPLLKIGLLTLPELAGRLA